MSPREEKDARLDAELAAAEDAEVSEVVEVGKSEEAEEAAAPDAAAEDPEESAGGEGDAPSEALIAPLLRPSRPQLGAIGALVLLAVIAVVAAFLVPRLISDDGVSDDAIAVVAGEPVGKDLYNLLLAQTKRAYAAQGTEFPKAGSPARRQLQDQIVTFLVTDAEYRQEAAKLGITVSVADVENELKKAKAQIGGDQAYQEALKQQGLTEPDLRFNISAQLLQKRLADKLTGALAVTDAEVAAYYAGHQQELTEPAKRTVRHILVKSKKRARALAAQVRAGADFAKLARRYSTDTGSKAEGGRLTIHQGETAPAFDRVAFALRTGAVSAPVKTQFGWHLIKAVSRVTPKRQQALAEVEDNIRQQLLDEKRQQALADFQKRVERDYADQVEYAPGFQPKPEPSESPTTTG